VQKKHTFSSAVPPSLDPDTGRPDKFDWELYRDRLLQPLEVEKAPVAYNIPPKLLATMYVVFLVSLAVIGYWVLATYFWYVVAAVCVVIAIAKPNESMLFAMLAFFAFVVYLAVYLFMRMP